MKLEVGQFVRFKDKRNITYIRKIREIPQDNRYASIYLDKEANYSKGLSLKNIIKASYNIIDILEVGDYVSTITGECAVIAGVYNDINNKKYLRLCNCIGEYYEYDIKSVITHEQMDQMAYKI
jgi:hypothetical protein